MKVVIEVDFDTCEITLGNFADRFVYESSSNGFVEAKLNGESFPLSEQDKANLEAIKVAALGCHYLTLGQSAYGLASRHIPIKMPTSQPPAEIKTPNWVSHE